MDNEIPLPQAALRLGRTWPSAHKLMLRGELGPARQFAGRWFVTEAGVAAYLERQPQPAALTPPALAQ